MKQTETKCSVDWCENLCDCKNLCSKHYLKLRKYGDPSYILKKNKKCIIENCNKIYKLHKSYCEKHYYEYVVKSKKCNIQNCNNVYLCSGFCATHLRKFKKYGDPLYKIEKIIKLCSIDDCNNKHYCKGFCTKHYKQPKQIKKKCNFNQCDKNIWTGGFCRTHYKKSLILLNKICLADGCPEPAEYLDLCNKHYVRYTKYGDINGKAQIKRKGFLRDGYKVYKINGKTVSEHKIIMEQFLNRKLFTNENIHHKDGNRLNNNLDNLELWIKSQPSGQRISDIIDWAKNILQRYNIKYEFEYNNEDNIKKLNKLYFNTLNNIKRPGKTNVYGYRSIYYPNHPNSNTNGWILEHRLIMSKILGRTLYKNENVHHLNGNKLDNRPQNLELWFRQQPPGQRVEDIISYAQEILLKYNKILCNFTNKNEEIGILKEIL